MLTIDALTRRYGANKALDGVSLAMAEGEVVCLVGPSGCGKSTLLRLVAGLDRPDEGTIALGPRTISSPGWALPVHKRGLNMVFQDYALWPHMRVHAIVGYGLSHLLRADRDKRVGALLATMQIGHLADRLPSQLSGGQQQRVAIARALATEPQVLLLDEPLSNLDVQLRLEMRIEFADLFARLGRSVLYVTHDPLEACSFADRLVVMKDGRIEEAGAPQALFERPNSAWIATLAGYDTRVRAQVTSRSETGTLIAQVGGQTLRLPATPGCEPGTQVTLMLHPSALHMADTSASENRLSGRVLRCLYEGRMWRATLDLGGQSVSMLVPSRLAVDEKAEVAFRVEDVVLFPVAA